jgi:hypothetical protein
MCACYLYGGDGGVSLAYFSVSLFLRKIQKKFRTVLYKTRYLSTELV